jgi:hypothetical protein
VFVLQGKESKAEFRDQEEVEAVVQGLQAKGLRPVLRGMLNAACESIGLPANKLPVTALLAAPPFRRRPGGEQVPIGDVFHLNEKLYLVTPQAKRMYVWEIRHHTETSELDAIAEMVASTTKETLDGRRVRGMSFDWKDAEASPRRRYVRQGRFHEERMSTKPPVYSEAQCMQSNIMVCGAHREFLLNLAQVGKARSKDTASISDENVTGPLLEQGLIRKEYLVVCKQDSRTLGAVPDKSKLASDLGSLMRCPTCGRNFKDELIQEIFALTDDTRTLLNGSHWMTIWITDMLRKSGVPDAKIKWNAAAGDDELDIVAEIQGVTAFFELKDREFGLGDAYPFGFRIERYGGDVGVVITMDKVASEAKKFISEQAPRRVGRIETIEGEDEIKTRLASVIDGFSRQSIEMFFWDYTEELGLNVVPLVHEWLDKMRP